MPWRRYKVQPLLWLRKEVFDAVLPLRASALNTKQRPTDGEITPPPAPTPLDAARQVGTMASALRKEDPIRTRYTTWVTEAWRILQWTEPTAKLFWEMLCMTHTRDMNVVEELPVAHVCLFLLLHLHPESKLSKVRLLCANICETRFNADESVSSPSCGEVTHSASSPVTLKGHQLSSLSHVNGMGPGYGGYGGIENSVAPPSPQSLKRISRLASRGLDEAHRLKFIKSHLWNIIRLLSHDPSICGSVAHSISTSIDNERPAEDFVLSLDEIAGISYVVEAEVPPTSYVKESPPSSWLTNGIYEAIVLIAERAEMNISSIPAPWLHNVLHTLLTVKSCKGGLQAVPSPPETLSPNQSTGPTPPSTMSWASMCAEASPMPPMLNNMRHTMVIRFMDGDDDEETGAKLPLMDLYVNYCSKSYIYVLAPVKNATIFACTDCTIVIGATAGLVRIVDCERIQLASAARRLLVNNCIECVFTCFAAYSPVLSGDNRSCMFAPHNAPYPRLSSHMRMAGLPDSSPPAINHWCHPVEAESAGAMLNSWARGLTSSDNSASPSQHLLLPPELFFFISVPHCNMEGGNSKSPGEHEFSPISLPQNYIDEQGNKEECIAEMLENLRVSLSSDEGVSAKDVMTDYFREWLISSGNIMQILNLVAM